MKKISAESAEVIIAGINRFLSEGYSDWSRENFNKLLSTSPQIDGEGLIACWQKKGFIELVNKDNVYIRVLKEIE
jgi:hypothetical protein